jgi:hypothetical protein
MRKSTPFILLGGINNIIWKGFQVMHDVIIIRGGPAGDVLLEKWTSTCITLSLLHIQQGSSN